MEAWEKAAHEMRACTRCHLAGTRKNVVILRGSARPVVLFLGEAPGRKEDETGKPFTGSSGKVLDRAIAELELGEGDYGITNVFMCRPPGNVFDRAAATACRPWLELKLSMMDPKVIVPLGQHALDSIIGEKRPIVKAAGQVIRWRGKAVFPLIHPAATFRRVAYAKRWTEDLRKLKSYLESIHGAPEP
jgi:DNA polymerase